ncbi:MAG: Prolyl-tRNA synthetase [Candidatus Woesebacteria bacterium GW2011_GWB1_40_101]|uniref:Proline--tRNA ligase n=1 Tax=Candidatus Woesebacteria bacterium GW2011_GWB1_40_101 TaxID=1618575 RepID=A0A0G0TPA2_9BACT|nr:MAG: Prolyl-tRNA synthetase [Candidatus Woesebacteria bacterium GW2011_GWB1_40_101]
MRQSQLFPSTRKEAPKEAESVNHKLLVRAGFIDQLMAGSWTLLPLGFRVIEKINNIIREEMNTIGGQELLMPLLHPKNIWNETGRWDKAGDIMYKLKDIRGKEYALSFTHEEIVMDLLRKNIKSYQDLPVCVYHFSTKFRNELRAKSGILRGREFMMKDLYSAHTTEEDLMNYYEKAKNAYARIFKRLGFNFRITEASGGVFTDKHTHEFQVLCAGGEDTIYICDKCDWGENKEIFDGKVGGVCPKCKKGKIVEEKSIEVGNIFPLGTMYAERMHVYYTDADGKKKPVWFGSYGIGPTRTMGAWVEVSHDERGIIWNEAIAPFPVHLIELPGSNAKEVYGKLTEANIEVLWDDRAVSAGEKFADADLIGIPVRLVVSKETGDKIEWKERNSNKTELLTLDEILKKYE